ncbi:MAG: hypothetical protein KKE02_13050 [Alphaproteobacteria bacterium]|nr:hypothetical protein [Alphaproteobacteria bacterium]MBU2093616.1 hypothetical protein [Alphaproteobacteria bacterium]MBU2151940.1 hypothetical protein [Alphaproteobacteria bacterium]MBU2307600.1 hypothetical protein [Alphaproteobacteria bacterium]MBU2363630.1 hypothetical protein [Alphaproteobacteria bacterium]
MVLVVAVFCDGTVKVGAVKVGRSTLARSALTTAGRVGRLVESLGRGCLVRSAFGHRRGHPRHVSNDGGAFKA